MNSNIEHHRVEHDDDDDLMNVLMIYGFHLNDYLKDYQLNIYKKQQFIALFYLLYSNDEQEDSIHLDHHIHVDDGLLYYSMSALVDC